MRRAFPQFFCLWATLLPAQDLSKLPDWAAAAARAASAEAPPADADAWVLLNRTEIAYVGEGEVRTRQLRLVRILSERGTSQGTFTLQGLGGRAGKVKKLKGWNLRPDGELVKLDADRVVTLNDAGDEEFSTSTLTGAVLDRVVKGSLVAFESLRAETSPIGPVAGTSVLQADPIRVWELEVAKQEGWFSKLQSVEVKIDRLRFSPWLPELSELPGGGFRATRIPPLPKNEGGHPSLDSVLPLVRVRFLDPALPEARMWASWDGLARWVHGHYQGAVQGAQVAEVQGAGVPGLKALWAWMGRSLTYKQVYLSPERGWVPEAFAEVGRKRYGDCKDLSCFFLGEARHLGFQGIPALARIAAGKAEPGDSPFPVFNHVIAALRLEASLGLAAEVQTPVGRFLLVDPTDPITPLGMLGSAHARRKVLLCLPDGGQWVAVPEQAILQERLDVDLRAEVVGQELRGTLRLAEQGNAWNLRNTAFRVGAKGIRDLLLTRNFDLPAHATLEVLKLGEPLALDRPFEVELKVVHPTGFRQIGAEWELAGLGIPGLLASIQKPGVPRLLPVAFAREDRRDFRASLVVPYRLQPVLPERRGESPFREYAWKAAAEADPKGSRLTLSLEHRFRPVGFGFEAREKGVQAWKKDRSAFKTFREEALAFKAAP